MTKKSFQKHYLNTVIKDAKYEKQYTIISQLEEFYFTLQYTCKILFTTEVKKIQHDFLVTYLAVLHYPLDYRIQSFYGNNCK
jgi:hypothetical protein